MQTVTLRCFRGDKNYGSADDHSILPDSAAKLHAVSAGQHHIEHKQRRTL